MNEIDFTGKTVYLAAPKRILSTDLYDRAFRYFLARSKGVMNPRWMFENNQDWLDNFERRLQEADVMVIVTNDNFVGKGVYLEYNYFFSRHCKIYFFKEDEEFVVNEENRELEVEYIHEIVPVKRLEIDDDENWQDYAVVRY